MQPTETTLLNIIKTLDDQVTSATDSLFANQRRKLRQNTPIMFPRIPTSNFRLQTSRGVTVVEVLFAMFVILFGLVGLAAIIPMAARQASDSYAMVQGAAAMQNTQAAARSQKGYLPTNEKPWWYANDLIGGNIGAYASFSSISDFLKVIQQPGLANAIIPLDATTPRRVNIALRTGLATGFCIDPQFCGDQFLINVDGTWRYQGAYNHLRNATQLFRRTRMPFFDESTVLSGNTFDTNASANFPRLLRVSFVGGGNNLSASAAFPNNIVPVPISKSSADLTTAAGGDLLQASVEEDKSAGALRNFQVANAGSTIGQMISSSVSSTISWIACLTPSEETPKGANPSSYKVSIVVFDGRDRLFDAVPLGVSGAENFPRGERLAFVTSVLPSGVAAPLIAAGSPIGHLPFTGNSGSMQVALHSADLTDARLRIGDWVMLSRQIETGNNWGGSPPVANVDALEYKMVHRHRWYRITGVDNAETWPRLVRLQGPSWDYEEIQFSTTGTPPTPVIPTSVVPLYGRKTDSGFDTRLVTRTSDLRLVATTAAIFTNVVTVYQFDISVE